MEIDGDEKELLESVERGEWKSASGAAAGDHPLTARRPDRQPVALGSSISVLHVRALFGRIVQRRISSSLAVGRVSRSLRGAASHRCRRAERRVAPVCRLVYQLM